MTVTFGFLGAGRIGKVHARAIGANPDARLVAVADAMPAAAEALAVEHKAQVSTIDAIAADPAIDAVVICTPTDTHSDLIEQFTARARPSSAKNPSTSPSPASAIVSRPSPPPRACSWSASTAVSPPISRP